jgi:hypothetical protein
MMKGMGYLYEGLSLPEYANSFDPRISAFTYGMKDVMKPGDGIFEYLERSVSYRSINS